MLESLNARYARRDFFRNPFTRQELEGLLATARASPMDVLSTRSKAFKTFGLSARVVSERELLDLMVSEPTLLRRPLIVSGGNLIVGFDRQRIAALVADQQREGE